MLLIVPGQFQGFRSSFALGFAHCQNSQGAHKETRAHQQDRGQQGATATTAADQSRPDANLDASQLAWCPATASSEIFFVTEFMFFHVTCKIQQPGSVPSGGGGGGAAAAAAGAGALFPLPQPHPQPPSAASLNLTVNKFSNWPAPPVRNPASPPPTATTAASTTAAPTAPSATAATPSASPAQNGSALPPH